MPDDRLATELAGIRKRAAQLTRDCDGAECIAELGGPCTGHDAERLADAVEAVLARHITDVIDGAPPRFPLTVCSTCSGRPVWPCPEVAAISAALLGETDV